MQDVALATKFSDVFRLEEFAKNRIGHSAHFFWATTASVHAANGDFATAILNQNLAIKDAPEKAKRKYELKLTEYESKSNRLN